MLHGTEDDSLAGVRAAFDAERFRREGHVLVDALADHLTRATSGAPLPVLPVVDPDRQVADWTVPFPAPGADLNELLTRVVAGSNHLHHPGYVGHQVTPSLPAAALCDLVGSLLNNGSAVYEMGPVSTALERVLVRFLAGALGMPAGADGLFTSGGSAGNLTALLAARQAGAGFDVWGAGNAAGPPLAFLCSREAHYSVSRALQIMGLGSEAAWPVPVDERFRLRPEALPDAFGAAKAAGRQVVAVVASACSTSTGTFDPLEPIADFAAERGIWFHVDGAHGATVALSDRHRHRVRGIERADSVVWDAHKMMMMPALCTAVIFRDGRRSYESFAQEASYLFADAAPEGRYDDQWFNLAGRTLECTKLMMSLKLYVALALHGPAFFGGYVDGLFQRATAFAESVADAPDFELGVRPDANIVCFRFRPAGRPEGPELDRLQAAIRQRILASGAFYLVQTRLPRGLFLRVTLLNPFTSARDLADLLAAVRAAA